MQNYALVFDELVPLREAMIVKEVAGEHALATTYLIALP